MPSAMVGNYSGRDHSTVLYGVGALRIEMERHAREDLRAMFKSVEKSLS